MGTSKVKFNAAGMRKLEQQVMRDPEFLRQAAAVNEAATAAVRAVERNSSGNGDASAVLSRLEAAVKQTGVEPNSVRLAEIAEDIAVGRPALSE